MSFSWSEYLDLARELVGVQGITGSEEAKLRSAISRAYYAAHRSAVQTARNKDSYIPPAPGTSAHLDIVNFLRSSSNPGRRDVGIRLESLRRMRGRADYQDQILFAVLQNDARLAIRLAQQILTRLASFA